MNPLLKPRPAAPLAPSIPELAAMPVGMGFDVAALCWVENVVDKAIEAVETAGPHSTVPETTTALVHAYFAYRAKPSPAGLDRILDASRDVNRSCVLADVRGNA